MRAGPKSSARHVGARQRDLRHTTLVRALRGQPARGLLVFVFLVLVLPRVSRAQSNGLHKLFSDYYEFQLREDPSRATFAGRTEYNDRWDDPSPEHQRQYVASLQQFLRRLHAIRESGIAARDRLSYDLLDRQLKEKIEEDGTISSFFSVNQLVGEHLNIFSTMAVGPANSVKDYENQVARLRALPK